MNLNAIEIENISKLEPFKRYKYFIKKIADFEELWTLMDKNGHIALSEVDNNILVSFWTAEAFITSSLDENWKECVPLKISLDDFEEIFIPIIIENEYLINVFPVQGKSGFVVNISEFIRDLNEELENYE
ncbi:DUF2750 domain-containing protein [Flavobacterium geliluteum]|uniref:DUF2750 domain-containing protein n=1 Tax=Flavobacterium geliluteum TaxID=2816120 RepID=A0A940X626_9FLAO|nr:DUF2750 domain-containing protein [Flavobacterium geliluteum]MBP4137254.1 DUF2750 domain-containing protein [Flavobacterium geliluteum]